MSQTLCIKCGSELKPSSYCELCQQPLIFTCTSCGYNTEEKVHIDCRNVDILTQKIAATTDQADSRISAPSISVTGNQEKSNVDKPKEKETVKGELESELYYLEREEKKMDDDKNFSEFNPFFSGAAFWKTFMTNWFNAYSEFLKNATSITEYWYNVYWKPWLDWQQLHQQRQQENKDKLNVE